MNLNIDCNELYKKCIYSSIAHAICVLKTPFLSYEQSWDGYNYSYIIGSSRGIISFNLDENIFTGAVRNEKSERINWYPKFNAMNLYKGAPKKILRLAKNETIEYLYDVVKGRKKPVVTVAFWGVDNIIHLSDTESIFILNGGELVAEILDCRDLKAYWKETYESDEYEFKVIWQLYNLLENKKMYIELKDFPVINKSCEGYEECLESLSELGFIFYE